MNREEFLERVQALREGGVSIPKVFDPENMQRIIGVDQGSRAGA